MGKACRCCKMIKIAISISIGSADCFQFLANKKQHFFSRRFKFCKAFCGVSYIAGMHDSRIAAIRNKLQAGNHKEQRVFGQIVFNCKGAWRSHLAVDFMMVRQQVWHGDPKKNAYSGKRYQYINRDNRQTSVIATFFPPPSSQQLVQQGSYSIYAGSNKDAPGRAVFMGIDIIRKNDGIGDQANTYDA